MHFTVCYYHVTYTFQSESTLYRCLNVKELLANKEVRYLKFRWQQQNLNPRPLDHLAKLVKWLSCVVGTYLDGAFDYMLLSCHVRVLEWIHTLIVNPLLYVTWYVQIRTFIYCTCFKRGIPWHSGNYRV